MEQQAENRRNHMLRYLNLDAYEKMQDEIKAKLHRTWRSDPKISVEQVQKALGYTTTKYYQELDRLGVEYQKKRNYQRKKKPAELKKIENSCAISFNGTYEPQQLLDQIEGLRNMIDLKARGYQFDFSLIKISD